MFDQPWGHCLSSFYRYKKFTLFIIGLMLSVSAQALDVTVTATQDTGLPGSYAYYRIVIANTDGTTRSNVVLTTSAPTGSSFSIARPAQSGGCSGACGPSETPFWNLGDIGNGDTRVITIPLFIDGTTPDATALTLNASVTYTGAGSPDTGSETTLVNTNPSGLIHLRAINQVVAPSENLKFEASFGNIGNAGFSGSELRATIPAGTSFVSATDGGTLDGNEVVWDTGLLDIGDSKKRFFTVSVPSGATDGQTLVSEARLSGEGSLLKTSQEAVVIRDNVNLTLDVTTIGDTSQPNNYTYYRYVVANKGTTTINGVQLRSNAASRTAHSIPRPLQSGGCSGSCTDNEWAFWSLGNLTAGESRVITVPLFRLSNTSAPIEGEPLESHVQVTEASGAYTLGTRPTVIADDDSTFELTLSPTKQVLTSDEQVRYELSFGNIDTSPYTDMEMRITLPSNATFISASDGGTPTGNEVVWALNTLNPGDGGKRFVTVQTNAGLTEGQVLTFESELNQNNVVLQRASDTVVIRDNVNLTLDVTTIGDTSQPNNYTYYRYVVANKGTTTINGVQLRSNAASRTAHSIPRPLQSGGCSGSCTDNEWAFWSLGNLTAGESRVITVPLFRLSNTSAPFEGEPLESHVQVTEASGAYTLGTRPTVISSGNIEPQIAIESDSYTVAPAGTQTFTIKVGNPTASALSNALITATLPEGMTLANASGTNESLSNQVFWPIGNVSAGQWLSESLTVNIDAAIDNASSLVLEVQLKDDSNLVLLDKSSAITVITSNNNLGFDIDGTHPSPIVPGSIIDLALNTSNTGTTQIANIDLYLNVPILTSATSTGVSGGCSGSCDSAEWAFWNVGDLNGGVSDQRTLSPQLFTGTNEAPLGQLLVASSVLLNDTVPGHGQSLSRVFGVGTEFNIDDDHDSDADGIPDWWEIRWGYDRLDSGDALTDDDADGANNLEEYLEDTDPTNPDTDGDGILDGPDNNLGDLPPIANAGPDDTASVNVVVNLDGSASRDQDDPNNTVPVIYSWSQTSGTTVTLDNTSSATPSFTSPGIATTLTFELLVEDSTGNQATDNVIITIVDSDAPPSSDAGADQPPIGSIILPGDTVTLNGSNSSDDLDSLNELTFLWTEVTSTGVTLSDDTAVMPSFTVPTFAGNAGQVIFELNVTDTALQNSDPDDQVIITVGECAPTAAAGSDQTVDTTDLVSLNGTNSSGGCSAQAIVSYAWTQTGGTNTVVLNNANTATPSFTSPNEDDTLTFQVTVTDSIGLIDTDEVTINVTEDPIPVCQAGPDQTVAEFTGGVFTTLNVNASSSSITPPATITSYMWTQLTGPNVTLSTPNQVATDFVVPTGINDPGASVTLQVTCTSDVGTQANDTVIINITDEQAPIADAGTTQNVSEGILVVLDGSNSSDADGDALTYSWTQENGSAVTLDDPTAAMPQFTSPSVGAAGATLEFELVVSDPSGLSDSDTVMVNLGDIDPPVANIATQGPVDEGSNVTLDGSGSSDPDGDTLTYVWAQTAGPNVTIVDGQTATPSFIAPEVDAAGATLTFELTVSDGNLSDMAEIDVQVDDVPPQPPIANAGNNQTVTETNSVTLDASASSDPEGGALTYSWAQDSGPNVTLSATNTAQVSFTAPDVEADQTLTFSVVVLDEQGLMDSDTVTITIQNQRRSGGGGGGVTGLWYLSLLALAAFANRRRSLCVKK